MPEQSDLLFWWGVVLGIALCGGVLGTIFYAVLNRWEKKEEGRTHRKNLAKGKKVKGENDV